MRKVRASDGTELAVYVHDFLAPWVAEADKETILLLHGSVNDARVFNMMVPILARSHRVVRMDERGMGGSAMAPGTYQASTERFVADVAEVLDAVGVRRCHVYCQGSGGMIGIPFVLAHPDRAISLTTCQSPHRLPRELIDRYRLGEPTIGAAILKHGLSEWNRRVPGYRVFEAANVDPRLPGWMIEYRDGNPVEAAAGRYDWTFDMDLRDRIGDIAVPFLMINSEGSYQTPTSLGDDARAKNPLVEVVTLPGRYGQALGFVIPDLLAETLLAFLQRLQSRAA